MREAIIFTPYRGPGAGKVDVVPLVYEEHGPFPFEDITQHPLNGGSPPAMNMYAIVCRLTDAQITSVRQDSRFFISAKPDPAYKASDVDQWLKNRGFTDHPVAQGDSETEATEKLRSYFRNL